MYNQFLKNLEKEKTSKPSEKVTTKYLRDTLSKSRKLNANSSHASSSDFSVSSTAANSKPLKFIPSLCESQPIHPTSLEKKEFSPVSTMIDGRSLHQAGTTSLYAIYREEEKQVEKDEDNVIEEEEPPQEETKGETSAEDEKKEEENEEEEEEEEEEIKEEEEEEEMEEEEEIEEIEEEEEEEEEEETKKPTSKRTSKKKQSAKKSTIIEIGNIHGLEFIDGLEYVANIINDQLIPDVFCSLISVLTNSLC